MVVTEQELKIQLERSLKVPRKTSGLYQFLASKQERLKDFLPAYSIEQIASAEREAFIIKLPTSPAKTLYGEEGYQFIGRHLTLDKFYEKQSTQSLTNPLSYAHYTENYRHSDNNTGRVVHVYFDELGHFVHASLKELSQTILEVDEKALNDFKNNADDASLLLNELLVEKSSEYLLLKNERDELEDKLTNISHHLSEERQKKDYLEIAEQFMVKARSIQASTEEPLDARAKIIATMIAALKEQPSLLLKETTHEEGQEAGMPVEPSLGSMAPSQIKESLKQTRLKLIEKECADLIASLNISDRSIGAKIQAQKVAIQMLDLKLELSIELKDDALRNKIIKKIESALQKIPPLSKIYQECFETGDVAWFKELFNFSGFKLTLYDVNDFVTYLLKHDKKESAECLQICDFLFDYSVVYRSFMLILKSGFRKLASVEYRLSILSLAAEADKLEFFKLLLRHGVSANSQGLLYGQNTLSIIKTLIIFRVKPIYLEILFSYGAVLNYSPRMIISQSSNPKILQLKNRLDSLYGNMDAQSLSKNGFLEGEVNSLTDFPSDLLFVLFIEEKLRDHLLKYVEILAGKSALWEVALTLAWLSLNKVHHAILGATGGSGVVFKAGVEKTRQEIKDHHEESVKASSSECSELKSIIHVICPDHDVNPNLEAAILTLIARFHELSGKNLNAIDEALEIVQAYARKNISNIAHYLHVCYQACALLISQKGELTIQNFKKLILCYSVIGHYYKDLYSRSKNDGVLRECYRKEAIRFYGTVVSTVESCCFAQELQSFSPFKLCHRAMQELQVAKLHEELQALNKLKNGWGGRSSSAALTFQAPLPKMEKPKDEAKTKGDKTAKKQMKPKKS